MTLWKFWKKIIAVPIISVRNLHAYINSFVELDHQEFMSKLELNENGA